MVILKIKNNFEKTIWSCAECSTYRKISQFWRAVSRNLASEGNFKKTFTKNALFQKLIFKKFVCLCVHIIFPQKLWKFWIFEIMHFFVKDFLKLPSNAKIRETARQNWEIYQFVEHSAYAHKFFIIFCKNLKNPKSTNFPF